MASIFLSYVREDVDKARTIAAMLERAGHSIWWDRRIKGGAQYSAEIEEALTAAEKVVVLWSALSVKSAWVRDEAAFGRDRGNLVPVTLDDTPPPLGFRQFQTIPLTRWKAQSGVSGMEQLLEAVGPDSARESFSEIATPRRRFSLSSPPGWSWTVIASLLVAFIGTGWWWASHASAHAPRVAIVGEDHESSDAARQLALRLGELQSARGDAFQLISDNGNADLIVQLHATDDARSLRRDVSILSGSDKSILWSASLRQPSSLGDNLLQQVTLTTEQVLACALDAISDRRDRIDSSILKLYLNGCSRLEAQEIGNYDPTLAKLFEQVATKTPHLDGAWARLLRIESERVRGPDPPPSLVAKLRNHVAQAQQLGLNIGEIYAARAALMPTSDFLGTFALYDDGIRADPNNAYVYAIRGDRLQAVGRMNDGVGDAEQALQLDPLSSALMDSYISALAYSGKIDAAYEQLRKAEAMWPGAGNLQFARYRLDLRFGDPKVALATYRREFAGNADPAQESFLLARISPTPANIERAIDEERMIHAQEPREIFGLMQALGQFGRNDEAIDVLLQYKRIDALGYNAEVLFRPALRDMWRDPRAMAAAAHVGFLAYWRKSGKWPDFCFDPKLPYDCKKEAAKYPG